MTEKKDLMKFELREGTVLDLQPVNLSVLDGIRAKMYREIAGDPERLKRARGLVSENISAADVLRLFSDNIAVLQDVGEKIFLYCAGWGVKNDPPVENTEEMELLGATLDKPHIRRAQWVRSLIWGTEEAEALIVQIQELSR